MNKFLTLLAVVVVVGLVLFIDIPFLGTFVGVICALVFSWWQGGLHTLGFTTPKIGYLATVLIALGMAIVMLLATKFLLLPSIEAITKEPLQLGPFAGFKGNTPVYLFNVLIGWLMGGLLEEILFRGFLLSKIELLVSGRVGQVVGVVSTSAFFGYLHGYQGVTGQILLGLVGIILGSFFIMNQRNIWLNILLHGFINTGTFTLLYLGWWTA